MASFITKIEHTFSVMEGYKNILTLTCRHVDINHEIRFWRVGDEYVCPQCKSKNKTSIDGLTQDQG